MYQRKIQVVGGSSYAISLPKTWVQELSLGAGDTVVLHENSDGTLLVGPESTSINTENNVVIRYEDYKDVIAHAIFASYYRGADTITIKAKGDLPLDCSRTVRRAISYMSGTEIIDEDSKAIKIRVMLDKQRVNILQVIQRMGLLVSLMIQELCAESDLSEIHIYEMELDRLYHLANRILTRAMQDPLVLASSHIENKIFVPILLMITKRLEGIGDILDSLADYVQENDMPLKAEVLKPLSDSVKHLCSHVVLKKDHKDIASIDSVNLLAEEHEIAEAAKEIIGRLQRVFNDLREETITLVFASQLNYTDKLSL